MIRLAARQKGKHPRFSWFVQFLAFALAARTQGPAGAALAGGMWKLDPPGRNRCRPGQPVHDLHRARRGHGHHHLARASLLAPSSPPWPNMRSVGLCEAAPAKSMFHKHFAARCAPHYPAPERGCDQRVRGVKSVTRRRGHAGRWVREHAPPPGPSVPPCPIFSICDPGVVHSNECSWSAVGWASLSAIPAVFADGGIANATL